VATHVQIVAPSTSTAGSSFSLTVTAQDANNNTVTSYLGTVHFTSADAAAVLPSNYTFTAADAGVHTFTGVVLKTAGSQSITATDTVTGSITGNASVTVSSAAAKTLVVNGYPAATTVGAAYYVSLTGSDSNPGSLSQPFATINHGVSLLKPGDTLYIRGGTYAETLNDTIPSGTSWSAPITVASYPGETAIIKPTSPPSDAIIYFDFQSYVILKNLVVDGGGLSVSGID